MVKFYSEVYLPKYCFLIEAVLFLALRRVPQQEYALDGDGPDCNGLDCHSDARFIWDNLPNGLNPDYEPFSTKEFEALGLNIPEDYFAVSDSIDFGPISSARSLITFLSEKENTSESEIFSTLTEEAESSRRILEQNADSIKRVERTNELFEPHIERAWAKLFELVHQEKIQLSGLLRSEFYKDEGSEGELKFQDIDPAYVGIGDDFRSNEIGGSPESLYIAVRVDTEKAIGELLPLCSHNEVKRNIAEFGDGFVEPEERPTKKRRGAPHSLNWETLEFFLMELHRSGDFPEKKEACIAEVQQYAEEKLGKTISRSSVQRNLSTQFDRFYAQKL